MIFQTIIEEVQVKPEPTVFDWLDNLELSHDRLLLLFQINPENLDDPPRLLLEEFDSSRDAENGEAGGSVWLYPEDVSRVIEWLQQSLKSFRRCKELDARKFPTPYWGDIRETPPEEGHERPERRSV